MNTLASWSLLMALAVAAACSRPAPSRPAAPASPASAPASTPVTPAALLRPIACGYGGTGPQGPADAPNARLTALIALEAVRAIERLEVVTVQLVDVHDVVVARLRRPTQVHVAPPARSPHDLSSHGTTPLAAGVAAGQRLRLHVAGALDAPLDRVGTGAAFRAELRADGRLLPVVGGPCGPWPTAGPAPAARSTGPDAEDAGWATPRNP